MTANIVRLIENRLCSAAVRIVDTNAARSSDARCSESTRSSARLSIEKHPSGARDVSGFHSAQVCISDVAASGVRPALRTRSCSRLPMFDGRCRSTAHRPTNSQRNVVVADVDSECGPVSVDQRDPTAGPHHPRHLAHRRKRLRDPLQGALGAHGIEAVVRLVEGAGVADGEANSAPERTCAGSGDPKHLRGDVDADQLPGVAEIGGERVRSLAQAAPDVEQPLALDELQLLTFPRARTRTVAGHCAVAPIVSTSTETFGSSSTRS